MLATAFGGLGKGPTLQQLAAVRLAGRDLECDDVALSLVQELDRDTNCGRHFDMILQASNRREGVIDDCCGIRRASRNLLLVQAAGGLNQSIF